MFGKRPKIARLSRYPTASGSDSETRRIFSYIVSLTAAQNEQPQAMYNLLERRHCRALNGMEKYSHYNFIKLFENKVCINSLDITSRFHPLPRG